jgi:hypothetical protein
MALSSCSQSVRRCCTPPAVFCSYKARLVVRRILKILKSIALSCSFSRAPGDRFGGTTSVELRRFLGYAEACNQI